jgi:hypothetical protein
MLANWFDKVVSTLWPLNWLFIMGIIVGVVCAIVNYLLGPGKRDYHFYIGGCGFLISISSFLLFFSLK